MIELALRIDVIQIRRRRHRLFENRLDAHDELETGGSA
jgi:hypothetical protein